LRESVQVGYSGRKLPGVVGNSVVVVVGSGVVVVTTIKIIQRYSNRKCKAFCLIFTALHAMQTRSSDGNSVCPSVCLSVRPSHAWIVTKRWKDLSRFIYHMKEHLS